MNLKKNCFYHFLKNQVDFKMFFSFLNKQIFILFVFILIFRFNIYFSSFLIIIIGLIGLDGRPHGRLVVVDSIQAEVNQISAVKTKVTVRWRARHENKNTKTSWS